MSDERIAFIGGGNMARAIAGGLLGDHHEAGNLAIAEPQADIRRALAKDLPGVRITANNDDAVASADVVVLAVKPQILSQVCKDLAATVQNVRPLILSIAAGVRSVDIDSWLGGGLAVVKLMPNQPALLRKGISGMFANAATTPEQLDIATTVMSVVGPVVAVPSESDIDAVTAISGSGPAYFYLLIDMLTDTAVSLGLDRDAATSLALATAEGAVALATSSGESMSALVARVRSPGGTTEAALGSLEDQGIRDIFEQALIAARDRAVELADEAHHKGQD